MKPQDNSFYWACCCWQNCV